MNVAMPAGSMPAVSQIVDYIWQYVSKQINTGVAHEVTLPIIFKSVIGDQGIAVIATRFRYVKFRSLTRSKAQVRYIVT